MAKYKSNNSKAVRAEIIFKSSQIVTLNDLIDHFSATFFLFTSLPKFLHLSPTVWTVILSTASHKNASLPFSLFDPSSFRHYYLIFYYIYSVCVICLYKPLSNSLVAVITVVLWHCKRSLKNTNESVGSLCLLISLFAGTFSFCQRGQSE